MFESCSRKAPKVTGDHVTLVTKTGVALFGPAVNNQGRSAFLGETGKFYCTAKLDFKCHCCNGSCGPDNGCNCSSCQELDIKLRKLPYGFYVNSQGTMSYRDEEKGTFACCRLLSGTSSKRQFCDGVALICRCCKGLNSAWNKSADFKEVNPPY